MAVKKRTQSKRKTASKPKLNKSLKAKSAKKKAASTKKKITSTTKGTFKAKKASSGKKPVTKKKTTKKKAGSSKSHGRAEASKRKPGTQGAGAPKKTKKSARSKVTTSKKSTRRSRLPTFPPAALKLFESGLKLMQSKKFDKAKAAFDGLIKEFPNETELLDRAHVRIHACNNRIQEVKKFPRLQGADEYYEVAIAELNGKNIAKALEHLQHALKLSPKRDYIHYALAAVSAVSGDREVALDYLQKAIQYRDANRFQAVYDEHFESLSQDSDFIGLTKSNVG